MNVSEGLPFRRKTSLNNMNVFSGRVVEKRKTSHSLLNGGKVKTFPFCFL